MDRVALSDVRADLSERPEDFLLLDAFGHHGEIESTGHFDRGTHYGLGTRMQMSSMTKNLSIFNSSMASPSSCDIDEYPTP